MNTLATAGADQAGQNHGPVTLVRQTPQALAELEGLIRQGAGWQDVVGEQDPGAAPVRGPSPAFLDYELHVEFKHLKLLVPQVERFSSLAGKRVLDFGCGTGGVSVALASRGAQVVGVEPTQANVAAAAVRAGLHGLQDRAQFIHLPDTARLPFEEDCFDLVIANSVIEYIFQDRDAYLGEMWRVLQPGGLLYIGDTSNGLLPREMHSGRWLINYRPDLVRQERCVSGLGYWEVESILVDCPHRVLNLEQPRQARAAFLERRGWPPALKALVNAVLLVLQATLCRPWGVPLEAYLPWLNLAILKLPPEGRAG
ncbi:MAG: class I SAM-dependent methyltransferase [Pseudomonadota bacterium]